MLSPVVLKETGSKPGCVGGRCLEQEEPGKGGISKRAQPGHTLLSASETWVALHIHRAAG